VDPPLAGQVLVYLVVDRAGAYPSRAQFDGVVISAKIGKLFHDAYTAGRPLDRDLFVSPLHAETLAGLSPAIVVLAGCDMLRDEGRAYARRLHDDGVAVEEVRCADQPRGFLNFGFPAAGRTYGRIGTFVRGVLGGSGATHSGKA
jgi:acetyl esterase